MIISRRLGCNQPIHIAPYEVYSSPRDSDQPNRPPTYAVSGTTAFVFVTRRQSAREVIKIYSDSEYIRQVCAEDSHSISGGHKGQQEVDTGSKVCLNHLHCLL